MSWRSKRTWGDTIMTAAGTVLLAFATVTVCVALVAVGRAAWHAADVFTAPNTCETVKESK
jgi:hypothetical protein